MTDLIDRLEALGRAPVPHLDEDRLQAMEARVVPAAHHGTDEHRRRTLVLAVAAAVVLLVAGVVFASGGNGTVRLEVADGVILERPGTGAEVGAAGDDLPDGTRVEVRPGGAAVVDGERYGPGRYVVVDGRLESVGGPPSSSTTTTSVGATVDLAPPGRVTAPSTQPDPAVPGRLATTTVNSTIAAEPRNVETTMPAAGDRQPVVDRPTTTVAGDRHPLPVTTIGSTTPVDRAATTATATDRTTTAADERTTTTTRPTITTTSATPDRRGSDRP